MMNLGPHTVFILSSYIACLAVLAALVGWITLDNRTRRRELAALDKTRNQDAS